MQSFLSTQHHSVSGLNHIMLYLLDEGNPESWLVYCAYNKYILYWFINLFFHCCYFQTEAEEAVLNKKRSKKAEQKYKKRQKFVKVEPAIEEQFATSRLLGNNFLFVYVLKS